VPIDILVKRHEESRMFRGSMRDVRRRPVYQGSKRDGEAEAELIGAIEDRRDGGKLKRSSRATRSSYTRSR